MFLSEIMIVPWNADPLLEDRLRCRVLHQAVAHARNLSLHSSQQNYKPIRRRKGSWDRLKLEPLETVRLVCMRTWTLVAKLFIVAVSVFCCLSQSSPHRFAPEENGECLVASLNWMGNANSLIGFLSRAVSGRHWPAVPCNPWVQASEYKQRSLN